jgi:hypothetical protein
MRSAFSIRAVFVVLLMTALPTLGLPCSICRCGDPAFFVNGARSLSRGQWVFTIDNFYTRKSSGAVIEDHPDETSVYFSQPLYVQNVQHEENGAESQRQNSLQLVFNYGLSGRLQLMAAVPYSFNRISSAGEPVNTNGFGDPELTLIAHAGSLFGNRVRLGLISGVRLPLGSTNEKNDSGELLDQHAQSGTGAWAGTFGVQAAFGSTVLPLFLSTSYQVNASNDQDFRYGNVWRFNFAAQRSLGSTVDLVGEINGRYAQRDRVGDVRDPDSGGTVVYFSPGVRLNLVSNLSLRIQSQVPVVEELHGVQNEKTNFRAGLIWAR